MIRMVNRQNLFLKYFGMASLLFVMIAFVVPSAQADPAPGDACTAAGYTSPIWSSTGAGGVGYFLVCNGSTWQRAIQFENTGNIVIEQISSNEPLNVGDALIVGTSSLTCDSNAEGGIRYNTTGNYLEFCNGSAWTAVAATIACDGTPAAFEFTDQTNVSTNTLTTSNILLITGTDAACNVDVSVSSGDSPEFRVCSDSGCSSVDQTWTATNTAIDMNGKYLQVRDTTSSSASTTINVTASVGNISNTWSISTGSAGSCGASPTIGETCADGSVYAGQSPDGNVDMYIARCDIGMAWDSSNCTGTRSMLAWNNDIQTDFVTTGYTSSTDGDINTAGLINVDSDSATAGIQPHQAAQACADLSVHSNTDWYLPARDELDVVYENLQDGIPNDDNADPVITGFSTGWYWSSTENGSWVAYYSSFDDGTYTNGAKYSNAAVRCARKD